MYPEALPRLLTTCLPVLRWACSLLDPRLRAHRRCPHCHSVTQRGRLTLWDLDRLTTREVIDSLSGICIEHLTFVMRRGQHVPASRAGDGLGTAARVCRRRAGECCGRASCGGPVSDLGRCLWPQTPCHWASSVTCPSSVLPYFLPACATVQDCGY